MSTKKVLVTGACGLIGTELCKQLSKEGHVVFAVDSGFRFDKPPSCNTFIQVPIQEYVSTQPNQFDYIFHMGNINGTKYFYDIPNRLIENNIKLEIIGDTSKLPETTRNKLLDGVQETSQNDGLILSLAISYGARQELIRATKLISEKVKNETICLDNFDDSIINDHLYTKNLPDVDLLIRTSGEQRISNFLLWQISYAELFFLELLWPDFKKKHFYEAVIEYQNRARRFGKV